MSAASQSPKLKRAMDAIREIIEEENLGAIVVIHTPGYVHSMVKIDPAYSCCSVEGGKYVIKGRLHEDFGGDKKAMEQRVIDTSDMLNAIVTTAARLTIPIGEITRIINMATSPEDLTKNN